MAIKETYFFEKVLNVYVYLLIISMSSFYSQILEHL